MESRVALDADVLTRLAHALDWGGGPEPDGQSVAAVRIYLYLTNPLITPTVITELEQAKESALSGWRNHHFEEIARLDEFYRGCVKGMAERYIDYHPDPRDCRVVAEAECARVQALLTLNPELVRGLSGRSEAISVARPSEYWQAARVPHGAAPRITPAEGNPLATAGWWHW